MQQRRKRWKRKRKGERKEENGAGVHVATIVLQLQLGEWETPVEFVRCTMAHIPYLSIIYSVTSDGLRSDSLFIASSVVG